MKKLLPYLLLFILAGGGISCSDDDPTVPEPEAVMPPAPVASDITSDSFAISWEAVEGAVSYTYTLLHKNPHGAITVIVPETNTDALSAAFTDLKASTAYTFRIKALGDGEKTLDSEWCECPVTTDEPEYLSGPWVTFEVNYEERTSYYCRITATFTPNDKTVAYYATCVYGSYFDDDPDDPDFEPNTEEDMIGYLSAQKPISNNTLTESSWGYSTEYILAVVGVDADGNFGKLNWAKLKTPARSSSGDQGQSEAALRIQHEVVNSSELEGAPENCFATVYRFEPTAGARAFRYEDGYYKGDFAKKETSYWRQYFSSLANAYGEDYDGYYSGWKSSMDLEVSADGFYYYDVTFWDVSMANETFEVIYMAYDADGVPGVPACYTVTLPAEIPAVTPQQAPSAYKAAVAAANRLAHPQALPRRR